MKLPAEVYTVSPRSMPMSLPEHQYPGEFERRRIRRDGIMKWAGGFEFVGEAMAGEAIGVQAGDDGH